MRLPHGDPSQQWYSLREKFLRLRMTHCACQCFDPERFGIGDPSPRVPVFVFKNCRSVMRLGHKVPQSVILSGRISSRRLYHRCEGSPCWSRLQMQALAGVALFFLRLLFVLFSHLQKPYPIKVRGRRSFAARSRLRPQKLPLRMTV